MGRRPGNNSSSSRRGPRLGKEAGAIAAVGLGIAVIMSTQEMLSSQRLEEDLLRMEVLTDLFEKKDQMSRAAKDAILEGIKTEPLRTSSVTHLLSSVKPWLEDREARA